MINRKDCKMTIVFNGSKKIVNVDWAASKFSNVKKIGKKYYLYSNQGWFAKFDSQDELKKALVDILKEDQYDAEDIKKGAPNNQFRLFVGEEFDMEMNELPDKLKIEKCVSLNYIDWS